MLRFNVDGKSVSIRPMPFLLLMPSFNQGHFIREAVDSVLAQDDPDWELWIVDNSTDDTPTVMSSFADPRIRFHHDPERMDPGACLNWMLERAEGRDFSYIHTDNRLYPGYVREMRRALAGHPLSVAYCDMRRIREDGAVSFLDRRGHFDLARVFSLAPLGVPFAATTELARRIGGFRRDDVADDVLFCTRSFGLGPWTWLPRPLLDYRDHDRSRTNQHGGGDELVRTVVRRLASVIPEFEERGVFPKAAMREKLAEIGEDLRLSCEEIVFILVRFGLQRWRSDDYLDDLWKSGLVKLPRFSRWEGRPRVRACLATASHGPLNPVLLLGFRWFLQKRFNVALARRADEFRRTLAALALFEVGEGPKTVIAASDDAMTAWACRLLALDLGWNFVPRPPEGSDANADAWIDLSGHGRAAPGMTSLVW